MTTNQQPERFTDAPLRVVSWDRDEVPEGYVEVTFLIPETGREWSGKTIADITIKETP